MQAQIQGCGVTGQICLVSDIWLDRLNPVDCVFLRIPVGRDVISAERIEALKRSIFWIARQHVLWNEVAHTPRPDGIHPLGNHLVQRVEVVCLGVVDRLAPSPELRVFVKP